jgi:hypothetical protein
MHACTLPALLHNKTPLKKLQKVKDLDQQDETGVFGQILKFLLKVSFFNLVLEENHQRKRGDKF